MKISIFFDGFEKNLKSSCSIYIKSILLIFLFQIIYLQSFSQSGTINFNTTDGANLGVVANDGEGGSSDIAGVQFDIILINDAGTGTGGNVFYDNSGSGYEGITYIDNPGGSAGFDGISISTNDGSEFDFNGFTATEFGFQTVTLTVQGFKNGSLINFTTVSLGGFAITSYGAASFSDAIFGDVDEIRILGDGGGGVWFGTLDSFVVDIPVGSNTPPTASSFTAANGPFQNLNYTFSTSDFGYMDGDGDPLNNLLIEAVPTAGTLWVDLNFNGTLDGGEDLTNNDVVTASQLAAGQLRYVHFGSANTSFQFEVNDGTENSTGDYIATLNVSPVPTVTLSLSPTSRDENVGTPTTITATLSNTYGANTTVNLSFSGTATGGGVDYSVGSSTITINAGSTSNSTTVTNVNDALVEANETVFIDITGVTNGTENGTQQVTYTIDNDDLANVTIADVTVNENNGTATITLTLDNAVDGGFDVDVSTADGTATTADSDYTAVTNATETFAGTAGEIETFTISLGGDTKVEADETVSISMSNLVPVTVASSVITITDGALLTLTNDDQATVTIADVTIDENSGTATITLTLDNAVDGGFDVDVSTSDGTATTADSDYIAVINATETFAGTAGESETFTITLGGDTKVEADETVSISMSNLVPVTVSSGDINISDGATLTLTNDDQATVTIANVSGNEDNGAITVTVVLDVAVDGGFDVDVSTADGTATVADSDYGAVTSQTLTFAGTAAESETFTVTPTADATSEPDETVIIGMSGLSPTTVASGDIDITDGATLTILNDDDISVSVNDPTLAEGDAGTTILQFTVSLDAPAPAGGATVDYATSDGTATAGSDYTAISTTTLTFLAGESSKTVDVTVAGDETVEIDETLTLTLSNPTGTSVLIGDATGTGTITNDDQATVTIADVTIDENSGTATITVTVDNAVDGGFDVDVSTADGTATTADSDYTAVTAQTLTFTGTAGESETFSITLGADTKVEPDETVSISMSSLNPAAVAPGDIDITDGATLTITNDDVATLSIAATTQAAEDATDGLFTITSTNQFSTAVTVDITVSGTAVEGTDYATIGTSVVFPANQNTITIPVDVTADNIIEGNETVIVTLTGTNNTDVTTGAPDAATITITDDDAAVLSIVATTQAAEDATNGVFTVSTTNQFTTNVTVTFAISGTATEGTDYTALGASFIFPANTSDITITIPVTPDDLDEADETVIITLTSTDNADVSVGPANSATITITDDDETPIVTASQSFNINEDSANGSTIGTLIASDTDAGTTFGNWTINGGNSDGIFDIDPATGELTVADNTNLDRENAAAYTLSVTVDDGANTSSPADVIINIGDVNDELPVVTVGQSFTISEGIANSTAIGTVAATDPDVTATVFQNWMIVGGNTSTDGDGDAPFAINPASGEITINDTEDINSSILTFSLNITVNDGVNTSAEEIVTINVNSVNDAPSFTAGPDQSALEDAGLQTVSGWATNISSGPADEATQVLTFNVSNDNNVLFDQQPAISSDGTLTFTPAADAFGTAVVTVFLSDNGGTDNGGTDRSPDQTFIITVDPVNDVPVFTPGPDQTVVAGAMDYTVDNWATGIDAGANNEATQTLSFNVSNDNNSIFSTQPAINSGGDLTFSIADGVSGNATVTVSLSDDGGTINGGVDTSDEIQFAIMVGKIDQIITFQPIDTKKVGEDPFEIFATGGDSGNPIIFTLTSTPPNGVASIDGNTITLLGRVGRVTVTATQAGNDSFEEAEPVTQIFQVLPNQAFLPNLFTPNNDGQNDRFIIRGGGGVATVQFTIFDRNSNVVFESSDYDELTQEGWDGTSGGQEQPSGTYVWVVRGTLDDGSPFLVNGKETGIIRLSR